MICEACGHENIDGARFCAKCGALLPTAERAVDPLVGQVIGGRYRITGVLGEGGMGVVYVGEQQMGSTIRKVAVKTLHPHLSKDPSVLQRFHRECGTVAQLEHPNTIKFFDFGATPDGTLYIAMEFVNGEPLSSVLEKGGAIQPERVLKIIRQMCGALDEAHEQGIVHRDLKPDNVILTVRAGETDFVKVLDFGIAARTESADAKKEQKLTQQGMVLGTPPYMSPEQFTGKELDRRSDVYSLGVMAYEMLTGRLPFDAETPWQWATQHMTAKPTPFETIAPNAGIPDAMRRAIMRALTKDKNDRQASAREFYAELSGGGGITVEDPPVQVAGPAPGQPSTAAMAAVPDFGAAPAYNAPMQAGPMHPPAPAYAPPVYAPPPPPVPQTGRSGGSGLVFALVGVAGVLLVAIVVAAVLTLRTKDEPEQVLINPFESASAGATTLPPLASDVPIVPAPSVAASTAPLDTVATAKPKPGTPTPTPSSGSTGTKPTPTPAGNACELCVSAARAGDATGAARYYNQCSDAAQKARCTRDVRGPARDAAERAALNADCNRAKAIAAAAGAMGAAIPVPAKCK
jgi:serine/threonine-protein kinase